MLKPIFVWQDKLLRKVDLLEVAFLVTEKNYTRICFPDETCFMVRSSLTVALKKFPPDIFIRTHRAYAVSVFHIDNIAKDHLQVGTIGVPISKPYYDALIEQLAIIH